MHEGKPMRLSLIALTLLATTPLTAVATNPVNYTYAEAGYTHLDADENAFGSLKLNGAYLRGAWAINDSFHAFASYSRVSDSTSAGMVSGKIDIDELSVGGGWQMALSERVHFTTDLAWVRLSQDEKISGFAAGSGYEHLNGRWEDSLNAGRVTIGLRGKPSPRTEAWIKAGVLDGNRIDGEFVGTLGGQFNLTPTWGIVTQAEWTGDFSQYTTGVRARF